MGKRIEFTTEQTKDIIEMYMNYISISKITEKYQVNKHTIYALLERNDVAKHGHKTADLDRNISNIISLYKNGLSQKEIGNIYGVTDMVICKLLKKYDASLLGAACKNRKIIFTQSERDEICATYLSGVSTLKIAKKFQCSSVTIAKVLTECNIDRRHRKYELNEHYFDEINTPNKAYILGLLYADGSNCDSNDSVRISLQERDVDILEAIRKEISCERPLRFIDGSKKTR